VRRDVDNHTFDAKYSLSTQPKMKQFIQVCFLLLTYLCVLHGVNGMTIPTPLVANLTAIERTWNPTLFLAFAIDASELQLFIDPQLPVYQPFANGTAYILISLSNTTVLNLFSFPDAEVSTVIVYQNQPHLITLHLHFNSLISTLSGPLYVQAP
jgi:hypothetical protein